VERGDTLRSRAAWASSRPARAGPRGARCTGAGEGPPVCIRWFQEARPEPSRGLKTSDAAVGRRKASAPAPFFEVSGDLGPPQGGQEKGRAPHRLSMRPDGAPLGAPPPFFKGEASWECFLGLAFLGVAKLGCEGASRE
jgi:hypothetical protein